MRPRARRPTARHASCMPTCRATASSCWISTRPTIRPARLPRLRPVPWHHRKTVWTYEWRRASSNTAKPLSIREPFRARRLKARVVETVCGPRLREMDSGSGIGMNRVVIVMVLVAGALWPLDRAPAQPPKSSAAPVANSAELSYALGYEAGLDLGQRSLDIDIATVLRGVQDGYSRKKPEYSPQVMQQVIQTMQRKMVAEARAAYAKIATANLKKAHTFFVKNGKKQGVVTLPSGVQYKVLDGGKDDKSPTFDSEVTLQFRGQFLDGTVFADTADTGKPAVYPVKFMIPGWRQIITRMHVGDHWQVFVPPDQAYGIRGDLPRIGPNEALVFDIRLLAVQP